MELLNGTRNTVHSVLRNASVAINDPAFKLLEFENMFPAQVRSTYAILELRPVTSTCVTARSDSKNYAAAAARTETPGLLITTDVNVLSVSFADRPAGHPDAVDA